MAYENLIPQISASQLNAGPGISLSGPNPDPPAYSNSLSGMGVSNTITIPDTGPLLNNSITTFLGINPVTNALDAFAPLASGGQSLASQASKALSGATSGWQAFASDLFLRAVVIIVGFIFVAIGLSMFKSTDAKTVVNLVNPIPKSLRR
jgi:hypothetical protein